MSSSWPGWATAPVEVVPADPAWPLLAQELIAVLEPTLAPWLVGSIEHVGSTAVPGLAAKPIIDLQAPVRSLDETLDAEGPLAACGWHLVPPELDARPWRRMHVLPDGDRRVAHLHLVSHDHTHAGEVRAFRDALRDDAGLRDAYAELKDRLAAEHRDDRERYTEAKATFVAEVLARR